MGASRLVSADRTSTVPERVRGPPPLMLPGAALGTSGSGRCPSAFRGPPPLDAARRSTWEPHAFLLAGTSGSGQCPSAFRGPPHLMLPSAALGSLAARFCWQGQHFRLWTVPERVSGPGSFLLAGAALEALDGARARFGPPPLDAARRSTWEPRASFLLAGAALEALDGAQARFGAPPLGSLAPRFFYTHTRHTHVDSLTHTRQTHTRSLTVPFAHGA